MTVAQMRPTFLLESEMSDKDIMQCIRCSVSECPDDYQGRFTSHHAMISIGDSKRRFWSPWLHLEIRNEATSRHVFGRFSPHPSIWTGIMFSYLAISVLIFFALMLGISQQMASQSAWAYYFVPILLLVALLIWIASKIGQNLAQSEMAQMKLKIQECLTDR